MNYNMLNFLRIWMWKLFINKSYALCHMYVQIVTWIQSQFVDGDYDEAFLKFYTCVFCNTRQLEVEVHVILGRLIYTPSWI